MRKIYSFFKKIIKNIIKVIKFIFQKYYFLSHGLDRYNSIFTHMTNEEKVALYKVLKNKKHDMVCVEIGSYLGASSCYIALAISKDSRLYCIDTWRNNAMKYVDIDTDADERDTYNEFLKNTIKFSDKIVMIRKWSTEAIEDIKSITDVIDFLFIDGDHNYAGVKKDWDLYYPLLNKGSLVVFHDSGWADGVKKVIEEDVSFCADLIKNLPNMQLFKIK